MICPTGDIGHCQPGATWEGGNALLLSCRRILPTVGERWGLNAYSMVNVDFTGALPVREREGLPRARYETGSSAAS